MGIIYQVLLRNLKVKDLNQVDLEPFPQKNRHEMTIYDKEYLKKAQKNCLEKFNEIFIDGHNKRDLVVGNYPLHPAANVVAFTNTACDEYDGKWLRIIFVAENGQKITKYALTNSTTFSRFMLKIPEEINGEKPTKLWYFTGHDIEHSSSWNCYDLTNYDGKKKTSVDEEYYLNFRVEVDESDFSKNMHNVYK